MYWRGVIVCLFVVLYWGHVRAVTMTSTTSGNWNSNSTWSPAQVPGCGDSIIITSGHLVTVVNQQDYTSCTNPLVIVIYGQLHFTNGMKLKLPCNSRIYVFPTGKISGSGGGGSSNTIEVCGTTFWEASQGDLQGPACVPATLPGCGTVLPILLGRFDAQDCSAGICITWQTLVERHNLFFKVERLFAETEWQEIGQVETQAENGTSLKPLDYYFADRKAAKGVNYYRLRQFDKNGQVNVHGVVMAKKRDREAKVVLYPNPGKRQFHIEFQGLRVPQNGKFELIDIYGALVRDEVFELEREVLDLDFPGLASGVYFLILSIDHIAERIKLLID